MSNNPQDRFNDDPTGWTPASWDVPAEEGKLRFTDLRLPVPVLHAIADLGFSYCTPIQQRVLKFTLGGHDAIGRAQTGTGKTAAFLLTILADLLRNPPDEERYTGEPRALILAPTRELAMQIAKDAQQLAKYTDLNIVTLLGGMDYDKQRRQLTEEFVDIVVATPGRLLDFASKQDLYLDRVEILVIDEADRMLDMGFIPDVKRIVRMTPPKVSRQTLLFSATFTYDVINLSEQWTYRAVKVEIEPETVTTDTVEQIVYITTTEDKYKLLYNLITQNNLERVMVFANRRDQTRKLSDMLRDHRISCALLSGDVPQDKRIKTLENFREGKIKVLVATDVAGRGIHIEGVSHVVNFTLPEQTDDYVHRIGRTGRAGATGTSVSFACEDDAFMIPKLEEAIGRKLPSVYPSDELLAPIPPVRGERSADREREDRDSRGGRGDRGRGRGDRGRGRGDRPERAPRAEGAAAEVAGGDGEGVNSAPEGPAGNEGGAVGGRTAHAEAAVAAPADAPARETVAADASPAAPRGEGEA